MKFSILMSSAALLAASQFATAQTYDLSTSLGVETGSVGTLSFTQVGANTRLDLNADWNSALLGSEVFLSRLFLTYDGATSLNVSNFSGDSTLADAGTLPGAGMNAGYHFDYAVEFPVSRRGNRLNDGESISLFFNNTDADDFGPLAMVHLQGLDGGGSVKVISTPVPEPETYAMLALGLGSIVALRRRSRG